MPPVVPNPDSIHTFTSEASFERWLSEHHGTATEVWIKIHKKASGLPTITTGEALDVALCWGWIDAIRKSFDGSSFLQRYTARKKRSIWSLINTNHVTRLINAGRMQPPGYAQIEAAKADGRWDIAYSGSKTMQAPADLIAAIEDNAKAHALYQRLTSQNRYALSFRLVNLKTEVARTKRIHAFVEMLARGETIYPNGPTAGLRAEGKARAAVLTKGPSNATVKVTTKAPAKTLNVTKMKNATITKRSTR